MWINERRGREAHDTFPTLYRFNTVKAISRLAHRTGFSVERAQLVEGRPEYLRQAAPLYLVGLFYERLVNHVPLLAGLRVLIVSTLRKPPVPRSPAQSSKVGAISVDAPRRTP